MYLATIITRSKNKNGFMQRQVFYEYGKTRKEVEEKIKDYTNVIKVSITQDW